MLVEKNKTKSLENRGQLEGTDKWNNFHSKYIFFRKYCNQLENNRSKSTKPKILYSKQANNCKERLTL